MAHVDGLDSILPATMDLKDFINALVGDWVALMSGIASVVLTIVGIAKKWKQVPRWTFWAAAVVCFFFASARVWTTEHRARLQAEKHLEQMTIPKLNSQFSNLITTQFNRGKDENSDVIVSGVITNRGGPTVLNNWKFGVRFSDGSFVAGETLLPIPRGGHITLGKGIVFDGDRWWPSQAESNPIVTGGAASGWIYFLFRNLSQEQFWSRHPVSAILNVTDITGKEWTFEEKILGQDRPPNSPFSR